MDDFNNPADHALTVADRLLTRDHGFYRRYFAGLRAIEPSHDKP